MGYDGDGTNITSNDTGGNAFRSDFRDDMRVHVLTGDQSKTKYLRRVAKKGPFDIIIDDGSHVPSHQNKICFFLWDSLLPGGLYIIEDIEVEFRSKGAHIYGYSLAHEKSILDKFLKMANEEVNAEFSTDFDSTDKKSAPL